MSHRIRIDLIQAILLATALTAVWSPAAARAGTRQADDASRRTILDGVFTPAQAERGRTAYALECSSCHSEDLQGMSGPALSGQQFIDNWREDSVNRLFDYIRADMPPGARGSLSDQTYVDIITHILSLNAFPTGFEELTPPQLERVQFVGKDGPAAVPEFSLIQVVGCLSKGADGGWMLTDVSPPIRISDAEGAVPAAEMESARYGGPGTGTYRLVYVDSLRPGFQPETHVGHKLHAKGYLLQNDRGEGLSVTRLEAIATSCNERI